ncbi:hypothetical protein BDW02DRAFT_618021 [Decorospora gaudefroyi]|uniref:G-protein coupled receptors family 1 profile domain-containing protein n=1 Tax=Decorospora gaudefroyi TaxID=184978 RepID=A0A6A5KVH1_9PLEO|nr:hypothetical protein BDW02DRAFT_618021 [Decorospora gaudefroyi]
MTAILRICISLAVTVSSAPPLSARPPISRTSLWLIDGLQVSRRAPVVDGEPNSARSIFVATSIFFVIVMAILFGAKHARVRCYRARMIDLRRWKRLTVTQIYIFVLYTLSICFVVVSAVLLSGMGLEEARTCKEAIRMCLIFYAGSKVVMYLFLVERAHAVRAPYLRRYRDPLWLWSTIGTVGILGGICVAGSVNPLYGISGEPGRCHIGLRRYAAIPLLTCDIVVNVFLTLVFVHLMSPMLKGNVFPNSSRASRLTRWTMTLFARSKQKAEVDLHRSNQKTLVGCVLVIVPTTGNLAALAILQGEELGFLCLMLCNFDILWAACVLHWLTLAGTDETEKAPTMSVARNRL